MDNFSVTLPNGKVWQGRSFPVDGAKQNLLILTGMCEYAARYEPFATFLNEHGFNVCVLDAMGQGLNAKSVDDQQKVNPGDFEDNIVAAHLKIEEMKQNGLPTSIMGHSMGSFMTQYYIECYPHSTDKVILCGSNGGQAGLMGMAKFLVNIHVRKSNWDKPSKFFTNLGLGGYVKAIKNRKRDNDWLSYNEENVIAYDADPYCGVTNTNGFWKEFLNGMAKIWTKKYTSKISVDERILMIAGEEDPVGQCGKGLVALKKQYDSVGVKDNTLILYPHMRHEILNETEREKVLNDVLEFLEK
ncbi:MAG: lysophospholipase [Bacilli bacterium]|nr:lysophospholipase [Bacilli bacterium]